MSSKEEIRPWGKYEILLDSDNCKVKRIIVSPHQRLSYQYHFKREEIWTIVSGEATITLEEDVFLASPGDIIKIPKKSKHRIANHSDEDIILIEVQLGTYFGEDDIVRLQDDYFREL